MPRFTARLAAEVALLVRRVVLHPLPGPVVHRGRRQHDRRRTTGAPSRRTRSWRASSNRFCAAVRQPPVDRRRRPGRRRRSRGCGRSSEQRVEPAAEDLGVAAAIARRGRRPRRDRASSRGRRCRRGSSAPLRFDPGLQIGDVALQRRRLRAAAGCRPAAAARARSTPASRARCARSTISGSTDDGRSRCEVGVVLGGAEVGGDVRAQVARAEALVEALLEAQPRRRVGIAPVDEPAPDRRLHPRRWRRRPRRRDRPRVCTRDHTPRCARGDQRVELGLLSRAPPRRARRRRGSRAGTSCR